MFMTKTGNHNQSAEQPNPDIPVSRTSTTRSLLAAGTVMAPAILLMALNARPYWPFVSDDALISLRYAERLLDGFGLTWTEGMPVEGYSNLLWILLISLIGWFDVDLLAAARAIGFVCMAAVVGAILHRHKVNAWSDLWPPLIGVAFFVLAGPTGVWTIGGMEQPLVAALLAWGLVMLVKMVEPQQTANRHLVITSLCLGLICITRPDGALFTAAAVLGVFLIKVLHRNSLWIAGGISVFPLIFTCAQQVFRLAYYGEWLPNPALVKISPSRVHLQSGWDYVKDGFLSLQPFSTIALAFL